MIAKANYCITLIQINSSQKTTCCAASTAFSISISYARTDGLLQPHGSAVDRPGTHNSDAARGLLLRNSLIHEAARDVAGELRHTPAYRQSRKDRKKVEMLFGHMKRILRMDRLRLRGLASASDEFLLMPSAQNLPRLAQWLVHGPPLQGIGASV